MWTLFLDKGIGVGIRETVSSIPMGKLFLVTITAKVALSFLAWWFERPWSLGFTLPLLLMAGYVIAGLIRRGDSRTSDESFGDSCYYLGFVFTISSIAFALFDVPDLDKEGKLTEVAVRFGAAMISTFVGIIVRIYLTGFRRDADQALDQLEDRVIKAADNLRTRMDISAENFRSFDRTIHDQTKDSVTRFALLHEQVGTSLATKFSNALADTAKGAREVYSLAAQEMASAAQEISGQLRGWSGALLDDLTKREAETERFLNDIRGRLDRMTLPEDFFASRLKGPADGMTQAVKELRSRIDEFAGSVGQGAQQTAVVLDEVRANVKASNTALDGAKRRTEGLIELTDRLAEAGRSMVAAAGIVKEQRDLMEILVRDAATGRKAEQDTRTSITSSADQLRVAAKALSEAAASLQARAVRQENVPHIGTAAPRPTPAIINPTPAAAVPSSPPTVAITAPPQVSRGEVGSAAVRSEPRAEPAAEVGKDGKRFWELWR